MPPPVPIRKCTVKIPDFGTIDGWEYSGGIRQFCGVPYASLGRRWTRSTIKTCLETGHHDGTKLGARCPHPEVEGDDTDDLTPVPALKHFNIPIVDEKSALVMNIVLPPAKLEAKNPILVYVHGGSLLYGGSHLAIFDAVKFVTQSVAMGKPVIAINFNYRVGLGGFLASRSIRDELARDGHSGCGNFGLTDQQVLFEWVQIFGSSLGGDVANVTAVGESAGGISISNQLIAKHPPKFHRAACMSGLAFSIPAWTLDEHERLFTAVCQYHGLDPSSPNILDTLRDIPEQDLANASPDIFGVLSGTGNPCIDDAFYSKDPRDFHSTPSWLKSYMLGDVYHEGVIFRLNIMNDSYEFFRKVFLEHISDENVVDQILKAYEISPLLSQEELVERFEHMAGDAIFRIPNYVTAQHNEHLWKEGKLFLYHFDQRSRLNNALQDTAYHAHELLYLFRNLEDEMDSDETSMAWDFASAWIEFANGNAPWPAEGDNRKWKLWGQHSQHSVVTEPQDEDVRKYSRLKFILGLGQPGSTWKLWFKAIDAIVNKRMRLGAGLYPLNPILPRGDVDLIIRP